MDLIYQRFENGMQEANLRSTTKHKMQSYDGNKAARMRQDGWCEDMI